MDKITENLNKLSLPSTILIASLVLGGFYYATQVSKQNSIEKQQQIELQAQATNREADKAAADAAQAQKTADAQKQIAVQHYSQVKAECLAEENKSRTNLEDFLNNTCNLGSVDACLASDYAKALISNFTGPALQHCINRNL